MKIIFNIALALLFGLTFFTSCNNNKPLPTKKITIHKNDKNLFGDTVNVYLELHWFLEKPSINITSEVKPVYIVQSNEQISLKFIPDSVGTFTISGNLINMTDTVNFETKLNVLPPTGSITKNFQNLYLNQKQLLFLNSYWATSDELYISVEKGSATIEQDNKIKGIHSITPTETGLLIVNLHRKDGGIIWKTPFTVLDTIPKGKK